LVGRVGETYLPSSHVTQNYKKWSNLSIKFFNRASDPLRSLVGTICNSLDKPQAY
jgi:hypothetical protein